MKVQNNALENSDTGDSVSHDSLFHGTAKAWANLNGNGTIAEKDSFAVSSYTDNAIGDFTYNFANAMADANYSYQGTSIESTGFYGIVMAGEFSGSAAGSKRMVTTYGGSADHYDRDDLNLQIMGEVA